MVRLLTTCFVWLLVFAAHAQIIEGKFLKTDGPIPANITNSRVAVIVDSKAEDWQSLSKKAHSNFKRMGIDAMLYLNYKDLHGGQTVLKETVARLRQRKVDLLFFLEQEKTHTSLQIVNLGKQQLVDIGGNSWYASGRKLSDVLISLGVKMKAMDLEFGNYMIADQPEYFDNLKIYKGAHYKTYPSRLKNAPLAVSLIPRVDLDPMSNVSPTIQEAIKSHNQSIDRQNELIKKGFEGYPYKIEFVEDKRDELLYNDRFQFVLRFYHGNGQNVKSGLGYDIDDSETNYVTTIPTPDGKRAMKTISRDKYVYKFYIKQTVVGDVHVGRYYDAEQDFETALSNFVNHMIVQFQK